MKEIFYNQGDDDTEHPTPAFGELTSEIQTAGDIIVAALQDNDTAPDQQKEAWIAYAELIETHIDTIADPTDRAKAQIAAILHKATLFQRAGNLPRYIGELDDARDYAYNMNLDDVSAAISTEINEHIDHLPMCSEVLIAKLTAVIDDSDKAYLKECLATGDDMNDLLGATYGILVNQGSDPDQVFAALHITE